MGGEPGLGGDKQSLVSVGQSHIFLCTRSFSDQISDGFVSMKPVSILIIMNILFLYLIENLITFIFSTV